MSIVVEKNFNKVAKITSHSTKVVQRESFRASEKRKHPQNVREFPSQKVEKKVQKTPSQGNTLSLAKRQGTLKDGGRDKGLHKKKFEEKLCPVLLFQFAVNSAKVRLTRRGVRRLKKYVRKLRQLLKKYPKSSLVVSGYSSPDGSKLYNLRLSYGRAESVIRILNSLGIQFEKMKLRTLGAKLSPDRKQLPPRRTEVSIRGVACQSKKIVFIH